MKVAPGDVVHVKGTVAVSPIHNGQSGQVAVSFGGDRHMWIAERDIVHVESAPLKVGDHVAWRGDAAKGTIIAIDTTEGLAWIKREGLARHNGLIVFLNELERLAEGSTS